MIILCVYAAIVACLLLEYFTKGHTRQNKSFYILNHRSTPGKPKKAVKRHIRALKGILGRPGKAAIKGIKKGSFKGSLIDWKATI